MWWLTWSAIALSSPVCDPENRLEGPPRGFLFCMPSTRGDSLIVVVRLDILCIEDFGGFVPYMSRLRKELLSFWRLRVANEYIVPIELTCYTIFNQFLNPIEMVGALFFGGWNIAFGISL